MDGWMNGQWKQKDKETRGATMAQWICLRLPSCRPGFKPQAHHLRFYQFILELCNVEKAKINKRGRDGPFLKRQRNTSQRCALYLDQEKNNFINCVLKNFEYTCSDSLNLSILIMQHNHNSENSQSILLLLLKFSNAKRRFKSLAPLLLTITHLKYKK